jgi:hypothetical protein
MTVPALPTLTDAIAAHLAFLDAFDAADANHDDDDLDDFLDNTEVLWQRAAQEPSNTKADALAKLRLLSRYLEDAYREDGTDVLILRDAIKRLEVEQMTR